MNWYDVNTTDNRNNVSPNNLPSSNSNKFPPTPTKSRLNFNHIKHLYPDKPPQITHSDNNSYESLLAPPNANRHPSLSVDSIPYENGASDEYESSIPLSLTAQELTLEESKTYMRWYSDILARTNSRTISIWDVFSFLTNFKIADSTKEQITSIFHKISQSINIGGFFALLRVISHTLRGEKPSRKLIKVVAPVPTPPSILSKKRLNDEEDSSNEDRSDGEGDNGPDGKSNNDTKPMAPLDIDSFTQFLLTGERPGSNSSSNSNSNSNSNSRKRKSKKVKFSDQVDVHDDSNYLTPMESPQPVSHNPLDYTLPMDQLLKQMQSSQPQNPQEQEEEKEVLKDVEINNFQNLNSVDTVSVGGTPVPPSNFGNSNGQNDNLLKPNMTGPAQISKMFSSLQPDFNTNEPDLKPLRPNVTGPADMARLFSPSAVQQMQQPQQSLSPPPIPQQQQQSQQQQQQQQQPQELPKISLSAFTSQMTGPATENTLQNTLQNGKPPVPRHRSYSSPIPNKPAPPPPPPRRRNASGMSVSSPQPPQSQQSQQQYYSQQNQQQPPALPPKIPNTYASGNSNNESTANILDDLKALQDEVDKIRNLTGGF
ncbi:hypothetical protein FOB58_005761 [Candida parapsilosis]|uniref:EH domain-containing protein n=2 Tax=Candida parapsilosis TaxID=5480 RepID=G8BK82_CANPC|nr:uncharacterized protein CPAR2_701520 [Candida parapsilosis]KAF6041693.1 hypothetical protein FOB58_005761 [Candida parapsilosis]KAF6041846.1 hypothetical protein FOB59_005739 [Candida parapsilosis]KAF6042557.1 hypothetical protein FOB60_005756 [Candida parapsilosis]KAF6058417.1 hypothetical protein FOB61_005578 [Candida parapsilosis]KAI5901143.1 Protein SCD5 [Candida parapsilosis]